MTEEEERQDNLAAMKRQEELKQTLKQLGIALNAFDVKFSGTAVVKRAGVIVKQQEDDEL